MTGAGQRNRKLFYQLPAKTVTGMGRESITWGTIATVYGAVRPQTVGEALVAQRIESRATTVIETNWQGTIFSPGARLVEATPSPGTTGVFEIVGSRDPDGRRRSVVTDVVEVASGTDT
jgi:head-tail adaptor